MKNKIIFVVFVFALFSNAVFAANAVYSPASKKGINDLREQTRDLEGEVKLLQSRIDSMHPQIFHQDPNPQESRFKTLLEMYAHGPAVVTSPAFGVRRAADDKYEDDSPLMSQLSPAKEDLVLLHLRKRMDDYANKYGIEIPTRPIIALSGALEGQINSKEEYNKTEKTDINLSYAELDIIGEIGPWVTSGIIITYDDGRVPGATRVSNSKLKIDRGFMTFGQLNKCPLYLTVGQVFAPFGRYSSNMVSTPPTRALGLFKDRMILLGYSKGPFNVQVYGFTGETKGTDNGTAKTLLGHTGASIAHDIITDKFELDLEASVLGNMAETEEMQALIFAKTTNPAGPNELLHSRVWGFSGRVKAKHGPLTLLAEYVGAGRHFDSRDMSFNGYGAKPQALNVEAALEFKTFGKPSNISAGYGHTWEALALNLPQQLCFATYDIAFIKNTLFSVEYRHDVNYGWTDTAMGGNTSTSVAGISVAGRHKNSAIAKMGVYF